LVNIKINNAYVEDTTNADLTRRWNEFPTYDGLPQNNSYDNCFTVRLLSGILEQKLEVVTSALQRW